MVAAAILIGGQLAAAEPTLADLDKDPLFEQLIVRRIVDRPDHVIKYAESGAASSNVEFDQRKTRKWFIEGQRYGGDLIEAGLVAKDPQLEPIGLAMFDWGFARQLPDGSFGDTGDPFHSTSFFVESVARAIFAGHLLRSPDSVRRVRQYGPKLAAAAQWMLRPDVLKRGLKNNEPYTHRRWLVAAAWGLAGRVTENKELAAAAARQAKDGLALQKADGVNPEKGGFDVSYQAVGLLMAARYATVCDDAELRKQVVAMVERGLDYELTKIDAAGHIDTEGSTRVTSETSRSGARKTVDNRAVVTSLIYGAKLTKRAEFADAAQRVARQLNWIKE